MSQKAEFFTIISAIGCAIGIGFVMQSDDIADVRYGTGELIPLESTTLSGAPLGRISSYDFVTTRSLKRLDVKSITHTSTGIPTPIHVAPADVLLMASGTEPSVRVFENKPKPSAPYQGDNCPISASATPGEVAMVVFRVQAPCFAGTDITISHNGLFFVDTLSADGILNLSVPALSKHAGFTASFLNGENITAETQVDAAASFNRVVVQWQGDTGMQIHAREFGAEYGDAGHVWAGAARDVSAVLQGRGGFLTALGNLALSDASRAEVYTFPSATTQPNAAIDLTVEAEVTPDNCGKRIRASALQFKAGKKISSQDLLLTVPDCESIGDFLVLNNLLQNLTVASK